MIQVRLKPKKCRNTACRKEFMPQRPMQVSCGITCAMALVDRDKARKAAAERKAERAERMAAKEKVKRRSDHMKDAQDAFNAWVRERDHALPCISCGRFHQGQWHAGHYRTVGGNPELRFEPLNVHKQCAPCNNHKSGDIVNYRISLVARIGADTVAWLEGPHVAKHYSVDELKAITQHYRALRRRMVKLRESGSRGEA